MSWNRAENGGPKFRPRKSVQEGKFVKNSVDCSQSAIFSWDRLDIPRLTVTAILFFKCTEGAGVGNYSSGAGGIGGGGGGEKKRGPGGGGGGGGGGEEIGHFLELHNEVLNTMLAGSTTPSLSSPHAVFAQLFSIRFPRYLEAWNRLQGERNIYFHMTVQISNSVKTFQRKDKPSLTCH